MSNEPSWYVIHTYSGYENKVKANIEKTIENRGMHDQILEISVPMQDVVEEKNGQKKTASRKVFPGYVLIKMFMNDETWYVVRNTRGVTSFVGPGSKPVALTEEEVTALGIEMATEVVNFEVGDLVKICTGAFENSTGLIQEINIPRRMVIVNVSVFMRETPIEFSFSEIKKI